MKMFFLLLTFVLLKGLALRLEWGHADYNLCPLMSMSMTLLKRTLLHDTAGRR